jgi:type II secretory ATPase GspE/PulE/Tfp pilus assembly ATPase PilB-like protein
LLNLTFLLCKRFATNTNVSRQWIRDLPVGIFQNPTAAASIVATTPQIHQPKPSKHLHLSAVNFLKNVLRQAAKSGALYVFIAPRQRLLKIIFRKA